MHYPNAFGLGKRPRQRDALGIPQCLVVARAALAPRPLLLARSSALPQCRDFHSLHLRP